MFLGATVGVGVLLFKPGLGLTFFAREHISPRALSLAPDRASRPEANQPV